MALFKTLGVFAKKHTPAILTAVSVVGVVGTAVLASRAGAKVERMKNTSEYLEKDTLHKTLDTVKTYIPTASVAAVAIGSTVYSHKLNAKKIAGLVGAYTVAKDTAALYKDKIKEIVDEKKFQQIENSVADAQLKKANIDPSLVVVSDSDSLFYDSYTGRTFISNVEKIRKVVNDLNFELRSSMWISLNDFYINIGLDATDGGDNLGWDVDNPIEAVFTSRLTKDNKPCVVLSFDKLPEPYK